MNTQNDKSKKETVWDWLARVALRRSAPVQRPIDPDANFKILMRMDENDPRLKCFLDFARTTFHDHLQMALDQTRKPEERLRSCDSAAAMAQFIEKFEGEREGAKALMKQRLEDEAANRKQ